MKMKRAVMMAVLVVAIAALALPIASLKARAAGSPADARLATSKALTTAASLPIQQESSVAVPESLSQESQVGNNKIDQDLLRGMGVLRANKGQKAKAKLTNVVSSPQSGTPLTLNATSALSAALITTIGGRDNQFSEVTLIADWDGREDCVADREQKQDDFSGIETENDQTLLKVAISEHTVANGFNENVLYYGDSNGNFFVGTDINPGLNVSQSGAIDTLRQVSVPELVSTGASGGVTLLNPIAGDCTDDQISVTGIAVTPVADLADFGLCGTIGEVVYVSTWDTEGCASNAASQPIRTRIFAFGFRDVAGGVTPVGAIQILRSNFSNIAGLAVDDDGNLYYQLVDLLNTANGGAIFKATELPRSTGLNGNPATPLACAGAVPRINRVIAAIPAPPTLTSWLGTSAAPVVTNSVARHTNYSSGASGVFGNIVALASGQGNVLYAAVARSFVATDDPGTQLTEGAFTNAAALGATPSMVISFADCSGGFNLCTSPAAGIPGTIPVGDGFADVGQNGVTRVAGVNNFRLFVLGNGPDVRPAAGGTAVVPGTPADLLKVDMQIDFTLHSGIAVNEEGTVFVISGGLPAGIGKNMSPMLGEILCFEDGCPMDRRADFVDLRGNGLPNPPASGGNVGDGDSDRFDHIWYVAPLDQVTITPAGLSGLARGFLLYTNRTRLRNAGTLANLPNGGTQGDDATSGPIIFEDFDLGHQVAGGDDQNTPFRGDDNDGAGSPVLVGALSGGFEFIFGATGVPNSTCAPIVWNGFFLNSNGNITFGAGDTDNTPTVPEFRAGLPKIAPAWADLNPAARAANPINFPVQALGFANVNAYRVRYLNVPEFGFEGCSTTALGIGGNTFGITLYDDGTGASPDENNSRALNPANPIGNNSVPFDLLEGPTDLRFTREPNTGQIIGCSPRRDGSGHFWFDYGRMELLGTADRPVIVGYSIGAQSPLNPPGLCEVNLSEVARAADLNPFGVINGQVASIQACLIGEGTEPTVYELFNSGSDQTIGSGGEITFATPDFDLRFEGNDPLLCTPTRQRDNNRGKLGFFGIGCPLNPQCQLVTPVGTVAVAPNQPAVGSAAAGSQRDSAGNRIATPTSGIINAVCNVQLNFLGCFFIPNEVTIVCQGFSNETGVPIVRPGKTVTSALSLICDTDGNGVPDTATALVNVTPLNINLVRGTLAAPAAVGLTGTAFPLSCCGGLADLTLTTTFTTGDNNIFGAFALTSTCRIDLGVRAPVVISVTPSEGDCGTPQDLLISGACFVLPSTLVGAGSTINVTSVFAVESGNANNVIQASRFVVLNANLIDAFFNFGTANAGKTFLIFVSGPNGTSQNLTTLPAGTAGCPTGFLGSLQGVQVTFRCRSAANPGGTGGPNVPVISNIVMDEGALIITGSNFFDGASVFVNATKAKKVKYKGLVTGSNTFDRLVVKLGAAACGQLPGNVTVQQSGASSAPFRVNQTCQ